MPSAQVFLTTYVRIYYGRLGVITATYELMVR